MREVDTERAILNLLHRHEVLTMDEILTVGYPACTWSDVFVALDRLNRQQLIVLHRVGLRDHISLRNTEWPIGQAPQQEEPVGNQR